VSIPYSALAVAATFALCLLSYLEHTRTVRPSFLLEGYLLFTLLLDLAQTRTLWIRQTENDGNKVAIVFTVGVSLKFCGLLLEAAQKQGYLRSEYKGYPPEATGGIFSRGFFAWLNPLFIRGFSGVLKVDDLYDLDKHLAGEDIHRRMEASWAKGTVFTYRVDPACCAITYLHLI
jgi:ATP-binding cassette subfamily C (CFTR/MRP) protein 1